jgi:hypothetical protein
VRRLQGADLSLLREQGCPALRHRSRPPVGTPGSGGSHSAGADPQAGLHALAETILATYRDADAEHKVQLDAISALPDEQQRILKDLQRRLVAIMADTIRATAPELFMERPELLKPAAMSAFGMLNWFYMWHREGSGLSREAYAAMVADFILGGLHRIAEGKADALEKAL